jgi:hypothetical protein
MGESKMDKGKMTSFRFVAEDIAKLNDLVRAELAKPQATFFASHHVNRSSILRALIEKAHADHIKEVDRIERSIQRARRRAKQSSSAKSAK